MPNLKRRIELLEGLRLNENFSALTVRELDAQIAKLEAEIAELEQDHATH